MPDIRNDEAVEELLATTNSQKVADTINDYIALNRKRYSGVNEIESALKAESDRRKKFNRLINAGVIISSVLYLALLVIIFSLFYYSVKLGVFDLFNWKVLSILGVVLGLPAAVILLSLAKLTSKPYRLSNKDDDRDRGSNVSLVPAVEASKEGMGIIKDLVSIIKGK